MSPAQALLGMQPDLCPAVYTLVRVLLKKTSTSYLLFFSCFGKKTQILFQKAQKIFCTE